MLLLKCKTEKLEELLLDLVNDNLLPIFLAHVEVTVKEKRFNFNTTPYHLYNSISLCIRSY